MASSTMSISVGVVPHVLSDHTSLVGVSVVADSEFSEAASPVAVAGVLFVAVVSLEPELPQATRENAMTLVNSNDSNFFILYLSFLRYGKHIDFF